MSTIYRIATAQYNIGRLGSWAEYEAKVRHWVEEAAGI